MAESPKIWAHALQVLASPNGNDQQDWQTQYFSFLRRNFNLLSFRFQQWLYEASNILFMLNFLWETKAMIKLLKLPREVLFSIIAPG